MFSEGKTTTDVVIELDLPAHKVRGIIREYWELNGMYNVLQVYDQIRYYVHSFLRLHKILNELGMGEQE
jgi:hypothetical protein